MRGEEHLRLQTQQPRWGREMETGTWGIAQYTGDKAVGNPRSPVFWVSLLSTETFLLGQKGKEWTDYCCLESSSLAILKLIV